MSGVITQISKSTNTTAHTSGTAFSASILKGLMKANWDNSNGEVATDLFMGSYLKTIFDGFTAGATKYMASKDVAVHDFVDIYDSGGFGRLKVYVHRYVQQAGDATGRILAIRPEKIKLAMFDQPHIHEVAEAGPYKQRAVLGALTVEVRNQDSNWFSTGFSIG
jgi:hypothetical protein